MAKTAYRNVHQFADDTQIYARFSKDRVYHLHIQGEKIIVFNGTPSILFTEKAKSLIF